MPYTELVELIEALAAQLERKREVSAQVIRYLGRTYEVEEDRIGEFLVNELPKREDDEIDLILSPLFTPKLSDQALFAELLGAQAVARREWGGLVQSLAERPTRAQLVTSDGRSHSVALREVTIERYVHRLRLDGAVSETILNLVGRAPAEDRAMLLAVARRPAWENPGGSEILMQYLTAGLEGGAYRLGDAVDLLNLAESYKPGGVADLLAMIPHWQEVLRHELNTGTAKPFFNQRAEELHGGDRDQRHHDAGRLEAKQNEFAFLGRLQQLLAG